MAQPSPASLGRLLEMGAAGYIAKEDHSLSEIRGVNCTQMT